MNPGDVRFIGGRLMSSPALATVMIEPRVAVESLRPGTLIRLGYAHTHERSTMRPGYGAVRSVDYTSGELTFDLPVSTLIVAAADGDNVFEYEPPCSRCECKRCSGERALSLPNGSGVSQP